MAEQRLTLPDPVRVIDAHVATLPAEAGRVDRLDGPGPYLPHDLSPRSGD
ncbi:MAG: hypothetical protein ACHRXM_20490 [Isosphaerales bacterium]